MPLQPRLLFPRGRDPTPRPWGFFCASSPVGNDAAPAPFDRLVARLCPGPALKPRGFWVLAGLFTTVSGLILRWIGLAHGGPEPIRRRSHSFVWRACLPAIAYGARPLPRQLPSPGRTRGAFLWGSPWLRRRQPQDHIAVALA